MAHIDPIRKEIERILNYSFNAFYVWKREEGYVLSLSPYPKDKRTALQDKELKKLPHIIKITGTFGLHNSSINFYFDRNPSEIKI